MPATEYRFHLPIRTDADLRVFAKALWGITIPDHQVCPHHSTPWRAFSDAFFARTPVTVWEGSRGFSGKSFTMAALGLCEAIGLGCEVNILGGSGEQSRRVLGAQERCWANESAPRHLLEGSASRITRLRLTGGREVTIQSLMASQASVRGPHPQRLRVDEVDEVSLGILDASLGQAMSRVGAYGSMVQAHTLLSSTHQYPDGTMTEVKSRAAKNGWAVHCWCYKETMATEENGDGWLLPSEVELKRSTIPRAMWDAEYDLQEPNPTNRAIDSEAVRAMFRSDLGEWPDTDEEVVAEPPEPGARYASGADWARSVDNTAIMTLRTDCRPMRFVAKRRANRRPWPTMVGWFERRMEMYGDAAAHDATGLGDVIDGYMKKPATPVKLVGRERADLFSEYVAAIERGEIVSPRFADVEREHRYCSIDDLTGAGHPPDTFVGGALAHYAATKLRRGAFAVA